MMWGWGHAFWGPLMMFLFWGGLVAIVVLILKGSTGPGYQPPDRGDASPARRVLDERLARGDISPEEYRERSELLDRTRS